MSKKHRTFEFSSHPWYSIEKYLGGGAFGEVYLVVDRNDENKK